MSRARTARRGLGAIGLLLAVGCGPRILIATGTTLGLKATPGDGQSRPPQVTLGYKRAEVALVPTAGHKATRSSATSPVDQDAFSTMAAFDFETRWFGKTELSSFIATGFAAHELPTNPGFTSAFAKATTGVVPEDILARQKTLIGKQSRLTEEQAKTVLSFAGLSVEGGNARNSLQDRISHADTDAQLRQIEGAFGRIP